MTRSLAAAVLQIHHGVGGVPLDDSSRVSERQIRSCPDRAPVEVVLTMNKRRNCLWRSVEQVRTVLYVLVQVDPTSTPKSASCIAGRARRTASSRG